MDQRRLSIGRLLTVLAAMIGLSVALFVVAFAGLLVFAVVTGRGFGP